MLERFQKAKEREIATLRSLAAEGRLPEPLKKERPDFTAALAHPAPASIAIIAEYKRASPSRGEICARLDVETVADAYAQAGASALSILTEETWFHGHMDFLARAASILCQPLPLLRKDFIFDPLQVHATAATPASALLLIVRLTPQPRLLRELRETAESLGMQAVVEVFTEEEVRLARESGARLIQVNARDLATLNVERQTCLDRIRSCRPEKGETWIAASGIAEPAHLFQARDAGYDAALVGTALMEGGEPGLALGRLVLACAGREEAC